MPLVFGRSILGFAAAADTGVTWTDPDFTTASFTSTKDISSQQSIPRGIFFKSGTV